MLPSYQSKLIGKSTLTYSPLRKAFARQTKTILDQGRKQVEALKVLKPEETQQDLKSIEGLFPNEMRTNEIKN